MSDEQAPNRTLRPCALRGWFLASQSALGGRPAGPSPRHPVCGLSPSQVSGLESCSRSELILQQIIRRQDCCVSGSTRQGPPHLPETWRQVEGGGHRGGGGRGDEGRVRGRGGQGGARRGEGGCWGQGRGVGGRAEGRRGGGGAPWPEATARHPRQPPSRTGSCLLVGGAPRPQADGSACGHRGRRQRR